VQEEALCGWGVLLSECCGRDNLRLAYGVSMIAQHMLEAVWFIATKSLLALYITPAFQWDTQHFGLSM
jgi:hypothetical protein